jgi:hypothetical protein
MRIDRTQRGWAFASIAILGGIALVIVERRQAR